MKNKRVLMLIMFGFVNLYTLLSQVPPPPPPPVDENAGSPIEGNLVYLLIAAIIYSLINIGYIKKTLLKSKKQNNLA